MGKSSPSTPEPPDPKETAAAQTASNKETAYWNAMLNNVNQITPYGNLTYTQTAGGPQYNMDAYNKAMEAYQANPGTSTPTATNGALLLTNGNVKVGSGINARILSRADAEKEGYFSGSGGSANMPQMSDFKTSDLAPQFTSEIKLTPEAQSILDKQLYGQNALAQLGNDQLGRIQESAATPFSFADAPAVFGGGDTAAAQAKAEEAIYSRLNPQFAQDEEAMRSRLINQGIGQGSEAYNREMDTFNQAKNDARMQAVLSGQQYASGLLGDSLTRRNQAIEEYTTQRNAPLNEYNAFTSGSQVQNPSFSSAGYQGAQGVDYASLVNNQYQAQLAAANAKTASNNSAMSSLMGLGGSFLGSNAGSAAIAGLFSDRRLKENIVKVGKTDGGHNVYLFNYINDETKTTQMGVMAQEVLETQPEAVLMDESGFYRVKYEVLK
jgi:hypothetical protein